MPTLVRGFVYAGPILMLSTLLAGCTVGTLSRDAAPTATCPTAIPAEPAVAASPEAADAHAYAENIAFFIRALKARTERREALWRANRNSDGSEDDELRAALLQSLPDHSGYDPNNARKRFMALLMRKPRDDIADLARLGLAELQTREDARSEASRLRDRVDKLIEIEHSISRQER